MSKKIFLVISIVFSLFFYYSYSFALTNNIQEGMNNAGDELKNSWDKLGNSVQNAGNAVKTGVNNISDAMTDNKNNDNNTGFMGMNTDNNNTTGYTAERTSTENTMLGMNNTMWTWLILAAFGIAVISLVWFYGKQNSTIEHNHHED